MKSAIEMRGITNNYTTNREDELHRSEIFHETMEEISAEILETAQKGYDHCTVYPHMLYVVLYFRYSKVEIADLLQRELEKYDYRVYIQEDKSLRIYW